MQSLGIELMTLALLATFSTVWAIGIFHVNETICYFTLRIFLVATDFQRSVYSWQHSSAFYNVKWTHSASPKTHRWENRKDTCVTVVRQEWLRGLCYCVSCTHAFKLLAALSVDFLYAFNMWLTVPPCPYHRFQELEKPSFWERLWG